MRWNGRIVAIAGNFRLEKHHYIAFVGWISKIITAVLLLINTRILIDLIGIEGFAAHSIIFSLIGWLALFNLGLPNAVQNTISKYRVNKLSYAEILSVVEFLVITIFWIAIPVLFLLSYGVKKFLLNNYQFVNLLSLFISLFLIFLNGLTEIYSKILFAEHRGYLPNMYPAIISISIFFILVIFKFLGITKFNVVLCSYFIPYAFVFMLAHMQSVGFIFPKFNRLMIKELFSLSKKFFIFALLAALTLRVDYIIMSKILNAQEIAIYNVDFKVFSLFSVLYNTLLFALWPVMSELLHKKEFLLAKKKLFSTLKIGFALVICGTLFVIIFKNSLFQIITGRKELYLSYTTAILTGIYFLVRIWTDTFAAAVQSINEVSILIKTVPFQAFISLIGQWFFGSLYGINGIFLGLILSFLLTVAWILPIKFYKIIKGV
ncbi:MATE family efflux transporter [Thermodesulfatator atlanticus]|uniref:MATE family efflux transporter n=1 Tax=Thermodesulfatator atlanticus TaxID=501497 RepID=UPI0003B3497F|nr:MATE family efflux transporter [Thermodesulfatator atlanticus]